nr:hypothetical protein [Elizabethkingia sp. ASV34]
MTLRIVELDISENDSSSYRLSYDICCNRITLWQYYWLTDAYRTETVLYFLLDNGDSLKAINTLLCLIKLS